MKTPTRRVLAVASGGGHWVQLLRLRPAFEDSEVTYMTTNRDYAKDIDTRLVTVTDANLNEKLRLLRMFMQVMVQVVRLRPDVVISTGAAPGFAAIFFGRMLGARTIWIDSIANSEQLSVSGRHAKRFAHIWLTQWAHLSHPGGPDYWGGVI